MVVIVVVVMAVVVLLQLVSLMPSLFCLPPLFPGAPAAGEHPYDRLHAGVPGLWRRAGGHTRNTYLHVQL
jgi:hypothetical protein